MDNLQKNFERFPMTPLSDRYNLVDFFKKKNLTSNGSKPIGVLTRTKSSCSDERLPIGYSLHDFQQNRSNFFSAPPTALTTRRKGVDT